MSAPAVGRRSMDVVHGYVEHVFNDREYDRIGEYQAEQYVQHGPFPNATIHGNEESLEMMRMFHGAFSDVQATEEFAFSDGEYVCSRYTYAGTHDGPLMGIEPTDATCEVSGTVVNRIEDGKIAEAWVSLDLFGLFQQVGVGPELSEPPV